MKPFLLTTLGKYWSSCRVNYNRAMFIVLTFTCLILNEVAFVCVKSNHSTASSERNLKIVTPPHPDLAPKENSTKETSEYCVCRCDYLRSCSRYPEECKACQFFRTQPFQRCDCKCNDTIGCPEGEFCDVDLCRPKGDVGDLCSRTDNCMGGLVCVDARCRTRGQIGDRCTVQEDCTEGLGCVRNICSLSFPYGHFCTNSYQCGDDMICINEACRKRARLGERCQVSEECLKKAGNTQCSYNSESERLECRCITGYREVPGSYYCVQRGKDTKTALEIYKITMIFASCCLGLILLVFLGCAIRKSYCEPPLVNEHDAGTIPNLYTVWDDRIGDHSPVFGPDAPPFEKPPSYEETIRSMREEIGIPPPIYDPSTFEPPSAPNCNSLSRPSTSYESADSQAPPAGQVEPNPSRQIEPNPLNATNNVAGQSNPAFVPE